MKKNVLFLFIFCALMTMQSCMDDSCSFDGKWTVQSADVKSEKLSPSIVQMTKDDYMNTAYEFNKDGKVTVTGAPGVPAKDGSWAYDETSQTVSLKSTEGATVLWEENFQMANCGGGEMTLTQRMPNDPSREAVAEVTLVIKKVE